MILLPINKVRKTVQYYLKNKIPFVYSVTTNTIRVNCPVGSYASNNSGFPAHELAFIKKVKETIIKNGLHHNVISSFRKESDVKDVLYFAYNKKLRSGDYFGNVYNVDIKSAYWETAYKLDLLPDHIYKKGKDPDQISKKTRLACIGSLARKRTTYEFDGKKQKLLSDDIEETNELWDIICYKVGFMLRDVAIKLNNDFIFFWVDGIYVNGKAAADKAKKIFNHLGYDCEISKLQNISITDKQILVKTNEIATRVVNGIKIDTDIKPFFYSGKGRYRI